MALIWAGTGTDETQDFKLYSATSGTVTSDTTVGIVRLGPRIIKCDSTGSNVAAYVERSGVLADAGRRVSFWFYFTAAPATTPHIWSGMTSGGTGVIHIGLNSSSILSIETSSTNYPASTVLSANTWYRITLSYTISSTTVNTFKLYINDNTTPELTKTNVTLGTTGTSTARFGMVQAFGASKQVYIDDQYIDDGTGTDNPGAFACTAKHYVGTSEGSPNNAYDTFIGTTRANGSRYLNVSEVPASDTNGWQQAATTAAYEKYLLEGASSGDLDISAGTVIGWMAWVRVKTASSSSASSITDNDVDTTISTTSTAAQFTHATTTATYPTGRFGVKSTGTTTDAFFYEGGAILAYVPGVAPPPSTSPYKSLLLLGVG